jgi:hypothetical protein
MFRPASHVTAAVYGLMSSWSVSANAVQAGVEPALVAVRTITIPPSIDLVGVVGSKDGRIAIWSYDAVFVVAPGGDSIIPLTEDLDGLLAVAPTDNGWEVVDGGEDVIYAFQSYMDDPRDTRRLSLSTSPFSAARISCGWVFQLWDFTSQSGTLVLIDHSGHATWSINITWVAQQPRSRGQVVQLVSAGDRVTATALGYPFETAFVECSGSVRKLDNGPPFSPNDSWIALGTVPIPGGFVTTYSDLASNYRRLRRRDEHGRFVQETVLEVPLGLVGSVGPNSIIGVRRTDLLEVVIYEIHMAPSGHDG